MCKAIDDLIEQGRHQGIIEGESRGRIQGELLALKNIMESMQLTLEQAMNALKIPMEEREELEKTLRENG